MFRGRSRTFSKGLGKLIVGVGVLGEGFGRRAESAVGTLFKMGLELARLPESTSDVRS